MGDKNVMIKCQQPASGIPCVTEQGFGIWPEVGGIYLLIFFFPCLTVYSLVGTRRQSSPPAEKLSNNITNNNVDGVQLYGKYALKRTTKKKFIWFLNDSLFHKRAHLPRVVIIRTTWLNRIRTSLFLSRLLPLKNAQNKKYFVISMHSLFKDDQKITTEAIMTGRLTKEMKFLIVTLE